LVTLRVPPDEVELVDVVFTFSSTILPLELVLVDDEVDEVEVVVLTIGLVGSSCSVTVPLELVVEVVVLLLVSTFIIGGEFGTEIIYTPLLVELLLLPGFVLFILPISVSPHPKNSSTVEEKIETLFIISGPKSLYVQE